ncbi:MAG: hypothetical protein CMI13_04285 [Oleibacter sp.]|nr:hypothetical protein [Thalassolituus sp.]|tara:strand:- start:212 stop:649 length:438 start_codon:yes stop_codon:yes gene_type:complete
MQLNRCPVCHNRIGLENLVQDEAGREVMARIASLDTATGSALVSYIGLFRAAQRDLAMDRALKLINETLAIESVQWLTPALQETVEQLQQQRAQGEVRPLKNHNYLQKVLTSVRARGVRYTPQQTAATGYSSAAAAHQRLTDTNW